MYISDYNNSTLRQTTMTEYNGAGDAQQLTTIIRTNHNVGNTTDPNGLNKGTKGTHAHTRADEISDLMSNSSSEVVSSLGCGQQKAEVIGNSKLSVSGIVFETTRERTACETCIGGNLGGRMRRSDIESAPLVSSTIERKQVGGSCRLLDRDARLSSMSDLNCRPANNSLASSGSNSCCESGLTNKQILSRDQQTSGVEWVASLSTGSNSLNIKTDLVRSPSITRASEQETKQFGQTIKSFIGSFGVSAISTSVKTYWPLRRKKNLDEESRSCIGYGEVGGSCANESVKVHPESETHPLVCCQESCRSLRNYGVRTSYSSQSMKKQQIVDKMITDRKDIDELSLTMVDEIANLATGSAAIDSKSSSSNINAAKCPSTTLIMTKTATTSVGPIAKNNYIIEDKLKKQKQSHSNKTLEKSSTGLADLRRSTYCSSMEYGACPGRTHDTNYDSSLSSANNYSESIDTSATIRQCLRGSSANDSDTNKQKSTRNQSSVRIGSLKQPLEDGTAQAGNVGNQPLEKREHWDKNIEFLLAVIGFAVDLGNVWRFPYICYKNGGGAFLLPYTIMFILGGLPIFYLEMSLGQYFKSGCLTVWRRICPLAKGIGYAMCILNFYTGLFYNTIISWAVFFFVQSFTDVLPWTDCNNTWNSANCLTLEQRKLYNLNHTFANNSSIAENGSMPETIKLSSPTKDYFDRELLQIDRSSGIDDLGSIRKPLAIYLAIVFICIYFAIWKGVKSTGKAVWITALLPYFVLIPLLIRGVFLEGAWLGLKYYLLPDWEKIGDLKVWVAAAQQIYFSLGPGFGTLMALSSYNKFDHNCRRDALIAATVNYFASFISGLVIFAVLGYMATLGNVSINDVATDGPGLVFQIYPEGLATMRFSPIWSILFFIMVITLGIDSTFGGLESVITGLCDDYPRVLRANRGIFIGILIILIYICSLPTTTYGGNYVIILIEAYGSTLSLLFIVLAETIIVCWVYGADKFCKNLEEMTGEVPACGEEFQKYSILKAEDYVYPAWAPKVGLLMTGSSICCIPIYAIYHIKTKTSGNSILERLKTACRPIDEDHRIEIYVDALADKTKDEKDSHLGWQVQEAPSSLI